MIRSYYVYVSDNGVTAKVHRASCSSCNDGWGPNEVARKATYGTKSSEWKGPYPQGKRHFIS